MDRRFVVALAAVVGIATVESIVQTAGVNADPATVSIDNTSATYSGTDGVSLT